MSPAYEVGGETVSLIRTVGSEVLETPSVCLKGSALPLELRTRSRFLHLQGLEPLYPVCGQVCYHYTSDSFSTKSEQLLLRGSRSRS